MPSYQLTMVYHGPREGPRRPDGSRQRALPAAHYPGARSTAGGRSPDIYDSTEMEQHAYVFSTRKEAEDAGLNLLTQARRQRLNANAEIRELADPIRGDLRPTAILVERPARPELDRPEELEVQVMWVGEALDRPQTHGWLLRKSDRKLAIRLMRAIEAGVVEAEPKILRDINGKTYVSSTSRVFGKSMNADLKRLGF